MSRSRDPVAVLCGDLNLLRCFEGTNIPTFVAASDPADVTLRSRLCRAHAVVAPPSRESDALADLLEIGRRFETRPVLYYGTDDLLLLISRNRERLAHRFAFRMPPSGIVEDLLDEARFARLAAEHHLPVALPHVVTEGTTFYSYHAYVNAAGHVIGEFVGRKIRTYPMDAGVSTFLELVVDPKLTAMGREVVSKLRLVGPLKINFRTDPFSGKPLLLGINPRFSLWNYLGAVSGVNLPRLAHADLTGSTFLPPHHYRTGYRWLSLANDVRAFYRDYRPKGGLSFLEWIRSYRGPKVYDVFAWSDPVPFLASILTSARTPADRRLAVRMNPAST